MSPLPALIPLLLPAIPGLVDAIIGVVERFTAKPGTPEENKAALETLLDELDKINEQVQAAPLPGDEPPSQ